MWITVVCALSIYIEFLKKNKDNLVASRFQRSGLQLSHVEGAENR